MVSPTSGEELTLPFPDVGEGAGGWGLPDYLLILLIQ